MKKFNLYFAFLLYIVGGIAIIDWFIFCEKHNDLFDDFPELKSLYIARFPDFLKPFISQNPQPAAIILMLGFFFAGIIFIKQKQIGYNVLAATSFLFGIWNAFSIM